MNKMYEIKNEIKETTNNSLLIMNIINYGKIIMKEKMNILNEQHINENKSKIEIKL